MKNTLETRLGLFVALALVAAVFIVEIVGGVERFQRGYHVIALFNTVQELKKGDRVKMAGVEVGKVENIDIDEAHNKVRVTMRIRKSAVIRTDSVATVKFAGLLGQNFVSVTYGTAGGERVVDNFVMRTEDLHDLSEMMQKLDNVASGVENLVKSFTGDKIDNILGPFRDFVNANRGPLTAMIANLNSVSAQISSGKGSMGKMIYDDALYNSALSSVTNLEQAASQINATVADARQLMGQINSGQGTLGKLLKDDTLYRESTAALTNAREILQKVNQGQGSVGKLINDQEFYRNAKLTLQKLDKATEGLEDQGPLTVLGLIINNLF